MKVKIDNAIQVATKAIQDLGFDKEVAESCVRNIIEAELAGKKTHGLIRVLHQKSRLERGLAKVNSNLLKTIKETKQHLYLNANHLPGFYALYESLKIAIPAAKRNKMFFVGIKNADVTGYIGDYARIVAEKGLIFIGFNNSNGGLVPHGALNESPWGTDPVTFGIPANTDPVIYDSASSLITWGQLMLARKLGKKLPKDVAVDGKGEKTTDPDKAEALLPYAGHKGSGMAMMVEILGGVLTGSGVGEKIKGGWGSSYILIDPTMLRSIKEFKKDIDTMIKELKSLKKAKGTNEIYYPGEQSARKRKESLKLGWIEVDEKLWEEINSI